MDDGADCLGDGADDGCGGWQRQGVELKALAFVGAGVIAIVVVDGHDDTSGQKQGSSGPALAKGAADSLQNLKKFRRHSLQVECALFQMA